MIGIAPSSSLAARARPNPFVRKRSAVAGLLRIGRRVVFGARPIVLMYHRVANLVSDPWQMAVTPQRFAAQMETLKQKRDIVPMHWLANELRDGRLPKNAAAITFDDGYADVFENALPILQRFKCPATIFITSQAIGGPGFWWDVLTNIVLERSRLPTHLKMKIGSKSIEWQLNSAECRMSRETLHLKLHARLKSAGSYDRDVALNELSNWAGVGADLLTSSRVMTANELRQLAATDGIEVGAHTLTHPSLPHLPPRELAHEVADSVRECEILSGRRVLGFAYPFGDYNDASVKAVEATGLQYALTTLPRELHPQTHPYRIPRILVGNWGKTDFTRKVLSYG